MVSKTEETQLSNLETQVDNGGGGACEETQGPSLWQSFEAWIIDPQWPQKAI